MIKLEAGVGKGLRNFKHDVALIQAALKLITSSGRGYFSGKIDGKLGVGLYDALESFYLDHIDKGRPAVARNDVKQRRELKPNSLFLRAINQKLPSSLSSIAAIRHTALLYLRSPAQMATANAHLSFPFPLNVGEPLTKAFEVLFRGYGIRRDKSKHLTAEFSGFDVTPAGNYKLFISFPAIKFLDPRSAKPSAAIPREFARIVKADLKQTDWKIGPLETIGGVTGISATSVKRAPFNGTALFLPKFVKGVSISDINSVSTDKVVRKMYLVSLIHLFDIPNRLPEKDIRDILEILNVFASGYLEKYLAVLEKMVAGPQTVAGCGSKEDDVPDHPFGIDFLPACENHDRRYTYLNWTKKEADDAFLDELQDACPLWVLNIVDPVLRLSTYAFCRNVAFLYWKAVDQLGSKAHFDAQEEAQKYGWIDKNKPYDPDVHGRYLGQLPPIKRHESTTEAGLRYGKQFLQEVGLTPN